MIESRRFIHVISKKVKEKVKVSWGAL